MTGYLSLSLLLVSSMIGAPPAFTSTPQTTPLSEKNLPADCRQYLQVPFEPGKIIGSDSSQEADMESCDPEESYYGIATEKDPAEALACSIRNRGPLAQDAERLNGSAVLAMIFANGVGVTKDIDLARKFVCEAGGESFDVQMRLKELSHPTTPEAFDFCTGFGYGYMKDHCSDIHTQLAAKKRQNKVAIMTGQWSPTEKRALHTLETAKKLFFEARAEKETEALGNNRHELQDKERTSLEDQFAHDLRFLHTTLTKHYTSRDLQAADAELNKLYRDTLALATQKRQRGTTSITPEDMRETERLWLQYCDAWIQLGMVSHPQESREHWKTWMTIRRVQQLQQLKNALAALEESSQSSQPIDTQPK